MLTWAAVGVAFVAASFVKGTTGLGFPLIATPMVALVVDLRTAYALLVLPNIVMDVLQVLRHEVPWRLWRRLLSFFGASVLGTFLGTGIFLAISDRAVFLGLAGMILLFLLSRGLQLRPRIGAATERWLGPVVGLAAGILNGITNVSGPVAAIYLLSLDLPKREFVKAVSSIFLVVKVSQLAAIAQAGIFRLETLPGATLLTLLALGGFRAGLWAQDRVPQEGFIRFLYLLLGVMAGYFVYRAF